MQFTNLENHYAPLILPKRGEDLLEQRQYILDPVARAVIVDLYGIQPPKEVECFSKEYRARKITTTSEDLVTHEVRTSVHIDEGRPATFRAFMAYGRILKFTVDLAKVEELRPFYQDSPKAASFASSDKAASKKSYSPKVKEKFDLSILDL